MAIPTIAPHLADQAPHFDWQNPYLLLTPGPLSTSPTVRAAMLRDWCTWDDDYNLGIVTPIREGLVKLASATKPENLHRRSHAEAAARFRWRP